MVTLNCQCDTITVLGYHQAVPISADAIWTLVKMTTLFEIKQILGLLELLGVSLIRANLSLSS